jgi:hypothetical protein
MDYANASLGNDLAHDVVNKVAEWAWWSLCTHEAELPPNSMDCLTLICLSWTNNSNILCYAPRRLL